MMNKIELSHLGYTVYHEKLENGLNVYVLPKNDVNNIYTTFTTNYGSNEVEFIPIGEKKMIKVPLGIAHFLEHKMFEQENGEDPFKFFGERGSDANANTNYFKTTYLFSGPEFFDDNMNFLLDYVQSPHFTDQNVEKEKGIIEQEIKMYQDNPYSRMYEAILANSLTNNPMKNPVIGNIKSIKQITKEDLYACYNTFYHPSNMFVVVTGNVEPTQVFDLIKENQAKKEFPKEQSIVIKDFKEPDTVKKKEEVINMSVTIPKVAIAYKINCNKIKGYEPRRVRQYLSLFFDIKFGATSIINEELRETEVVTDSINGFTIDAISHSIGGVIAETKHSEEFLKSVKQEITKRNVSEEDFERKKKTMISSLLFMSDNIFGLNNNLVHYLNRYQEIIDNIYDEIKSLNIKEFNDIIEQLDFNNYNTVIIKSKDA